jgi:hypothetical protein
MPGLFRLTAQPWQFAGRRHGFRSADARSVIVGLRLEASESVVIIILRLIILVAGTAAT